MNVSTSVARVRVLPEKILTFFFRESLVEFLALNASRSLLVALFALFSFGFTMASFLFHGPLHLTNERDCLLDQGNDFCVIIRTRPRVICEEQLDGDTILPEHVHEIFQVLAVDFEEPPRFHDEIIDGVLMGKGHQPLWRLGAITRSFVSDDVAVIP